MAKKEQADEIVDLNDEEQDVLVQDFSEIEESWQAIGDCEADMEDGTRHYEFGFVGEEEMPAIREVESNRTVIFTWTGLVGMALDVLTEPTEEEE